MIILMQHGSSQNEIQAVCDVIVNFKLEPLVLPGDRVAIGIPKAIPQDVREPLSLLIESMPGVSKVTHVSRPFKLASLEWSKKPSTVQVKGVSIGPGVFTIFAGPCSVESYDQFRSAAKTVKESGATVLRGGAYKPRTSPYSFQGLAEDGLKIIKDVADEFGLVTISEVMSTETLDIVAKYVDILQIGARSMQNYPLLVAAGKSGKPIFLKRGPAATVDEFLLSAEYILNQDNPNVILCERGVTPIDRSYTRNTLDLSIVPVLKDHTHLPVVVDPSHGTGVARYVPAMAKASLVSGADGVMIEMHPNPKAALSDGAQSLNPEQYIKLMDELHQLVQYCDKAI